MLAKQLLQRKGVSYTEISVDRDPAKRNEMIALSQRNTVPQIFIDQQHIGGCDEVYLLERSGELDALLGLT
ncbi:MAG: glutaredoxin 3 [Gammaproteobacteria bacterium]|nr:glutaredoxin 3 [Gammaproteobacteria bacterium]